MFPCTYYFLWASILRKQNCLDLLVNDCSLPCLDSQPPGYRDIAGTGTGLMNKGHVIQFSRALGRSPHARGPTMHYGANDNNSSSLIQWHRACCHIDSQKSFFCTVNHALLIIQIGIIFCRNSCENINISLLIFHCDRLIGLGVRVSDYWSRGRGLDSRYFHNFKCGLGLERGPPSLARIIG